MLRTLKDLFDSVATPAAQPLPAERQHTVQLATAVLLVEVIKADPATGPDEEAALFAALTATFGLTPDELARLVELAEATAKGLYVGAVLLLLAYVGSRFVFEVLLGRPQI